MFWGNVLVVSFFFTFLLPGKIIQVVCESPVEILKFEKVESASQTVDLNEEKGVPEPAEVKLRGGESKPRRTSLMSFFRQMVSSRLGHRKVKGPLSLERGGLSYNGMR
jgi:hypothetical protein